MEVGPNSPKKLIPKFLNWGLVKQLGSIFDEKVLCLYLAITSVSLTFLAAISYFTIWFAPNPWSIILLVAIQWELCMFTSLIVSDFKNCCIGPLRKYPMSPDRKVSIIQSVWKRVRKGLSCLANKSRRTTILQTQKGLGCTPS